MTLKGRTKGSGVCHHEKGNGSRETREDANYGQASGESLATKQTLYSNGVMISINENQMKSRGSEDGGWGDKGLVCLSEKAVSDALLLGA